MESLWIHIVRLHVFRSEGGGTTNLVDLILAGEHRLEDLKIRRASNRAP